MNEKKYQKRLDFQQQVISKKSEEIESLKAENARLRLKIEEKDNIINSIESMRSEFADNIKEAKQCKELYKSLIEELKQMKKIMNTTVFKGRWRLIKFLMK